METPNTPEVKSSISGTQSPALPKKKPKTILIVLGILFGLCIVCSVSGYLGYKILKDYGTLVDEAEDILEEDLEDEDTSEDIDEASCEDLWWFDDSSTACEQDQFCGLYMYEGLQTFETLPLCESAFADEGAAEVEETGTITGSVGYPSEFIPEDMNVCADNTYTGSGYCVVIETGDEYTYGYGYSVEVPYGNYNVYAQVPGDTYKAYYSEFVPCGLSVDCPSHDPIVVTVDASTPTQSEIDPIDWYNQ